jgi:hypothetical protein
MVLLHNIPAIHNQTTTRDIGSLVGSQETHRSGHLRENCEEGREEEYKRGL